MRGPEYLQIIYGPHDTGSVDVLRDRFLDKKRQVVQPEHSLGIEALTALSGTSRSGRSTSRCSLSAPWSPSPSTRGCRYGT